MKNIRNTRKQEQSKCHRDYMKEAFDENGKRLDWCYSCSNMERALEKKDELLKKYPQVVVRDNATRKEKSYAREGT